MTNEELATLYAKYQYNTWFYADDIRMLIAEVDRLTHLNGGTWENVRAHLKQSTARGEKE